MAVYHLWPAEEFSGLAGLIAGDVARFWNLFVTLQGGTLAAYAGDAASVFGRFRTAIHESVAAVSLDPRQTKMEMIHRRPAEGLRGDQHPDEWISSDHVASAPPLTSHTVQNLRVGARWSQNADVDIYSATRGNPELYYGRTRTAEGIHVKDYVTAPPTGGSSFETIEFHRPVDIRQVVTWVNLYGGQTGPNGIDVEIRVWADDKVYSRTVHLACASGNAGGNLAGRATDPHWVAVNVAAIAGL